MQRRRNTAVVAVCLLVGACHSVPQPATPHSLSTTGEITGSPVEDGLSISTTDVSSDGRIAKIRGRVTNPYKADVDGIRYMIRIFTTGDQPRLLDTFQRESSDNIPPGESTMMRFDVESMYLGSVGQLEIVAVPKKL